MWGRPSSLRIGSPLHGGADRNGEERPPATPERRRPFTGGADRNRRRVGISGQRDVSPLHGGADRNVTLGTAVANGWRRPFTGARIETRRKPGDPLGVRRPFTGARIETHAPVDGPSGPRVAPSRGRGSKPFLDRGRTLDGWSPLHGGADRNRSLIANKTTFEVAPSRGRGSKRRRWPRSRARARSPLHGGADRNGVRGLVALMPRESPLHGGADRNPHATAAGAAARVAPSRGRGSKRLSHGVLSGGSSSPLHGGADRNIDFIRCRASPAGRPFTGARIETAICATSLSSAGVAPSRGRGSKRRRPPRARCLARSPLHGGADRNPCGYRVVEPEIVALHGGADRNAITARMRSAARSRPFTGARIETAGVSCLSRR